LSGLSAVARSASKLAGHTVTGSQPTTLPALSRTVMLTMSFSPFQPSSTLAGSRLATLDCPGPAMIWVMVNGLA